MAPGPALSSLRMFPRGNLIHSHFYHNLYLQVLKFCICSPAHLETTLSPVQYNAVRAELHNHLGSTLKYRFLSSPPGCSESVHLGWGLKCVHFRKFPKWHGWAVRFETLCWTLPCPLLKFKCSKKNNLSVPNLLSSAPILGSEYHFLLVLVQNTSALYMMDRTTFWKQSERV